MAGGWLCPHGVWMPPAAQDEPELHAQWCGREEKPLPRTKARTTYEWQPKWKRDPLEKRNWKDPWGKAAWEQKEGGSMQNEKKNDGPFATIFIPAEWLKWGKLKLGEKVFNVARMPFNPEILIFCKDEPSACKRDSKWGKQFAVAINKDVRGHRANVMAPKDGAAGREPGSDDEAF